MPDDQPPVGGALAGVCVLDFSHALSGPYCTVLLADFGASIYKVEGPDNQDMGRGWGPPFVAGQTSYFLGLNRGKQGLVVDLKKPAGRDLCQRLAAEVDVLVENFRPGTMERLGLGYEALAARNPRLVYCSISGYGQNGPSRDEAAMDLVVECSSGYLSITGTEAGELVRSGYAVCDINAGLFAAIGILTALHARTRTGRGQWVDVSMYDGMISAMTSNYMTYLGSGLTPTPMGSGFPTVVPYRVYAAADASFSIAVGSDKLWAAFCSAIGRPELTLDPRFAGNPQRVRNRAELDQILEAVFASASQGEWLARLQSAGIPAAPVRNFAEVVAHAQSEARAMFPPLAAPDGERYRVVGPPVKLGFTPASVTTPAPLAGEHTGAALAELLGLDASTVAELASNGVIGLAPARD